MSDYSKKNNDEIDLLEVISILWSKKWWIALSAFVFTSIAGGYAFTAKEQWTSKAEVIAPKLSDLGDYFIVRKEYARILGLEFNAEELSSSLFSKFTLNIESLDKRRAFFGQADFYKKMIENKDNQEQNVVLSDLVNKAIAIVKPGTKTEPNLIGMRISFFADTPAIAQDTLSSFIAFNSSLAYQDDINNFLVELDEVLKDLKKEKLNFERDLRIQKSIQLANLNKALSIAKEAGIKEFISDRQVKIGSLLSDIKEIASDVKLNNATNLFMLGETVLKSQIDVVAHSEIVYPSRYYLLTELLGELEPLLEKTQEVQTQAFSYQASPDYPMSKDHPKRFLILLGGLLIGIIIGVLFNIVKMIFTRKKEEI
ncbi:LPS O-antigen chain length determinant protein WzzB [Haemophilus haemoglobinophilus]|nr:LPS O-antigen chain length determinant protein WzzB [Canicola haemoglobinophilus]